MNDPKLNEPSPLLGQALNKFFHLPWPRKPLNKGPGKGGHAKGSAPKTRTTRRSLSSLY